MKRVICMVMMVTASCWFVAGSTWGAEFCVDNATNLQNALNTAAENSQDDTIKVVMGTYTGSFSYVSTEGHSITLWGGYTAGCASRVVNPANTILDGNHAGRVLYLNSYSSGNISVGGFTIQNGNFSGGGGAYIRSHPSSGTAGDITLTSNIFTGNTSSPANGGGIWAQSYASSGTGGHIILMGNTFTGNTAGGGAGGIFVSSYGSAGSGGVTLADNIITGNDGGSADYTGGGVDIYSDSDSGTPGNITLTNNIITGNSMSGGAGGGVSVRSFATGAGTAGNIILTNNIIAENSARYGGGISAYSTSGSGTAGDITLTNNTITENTATDSAGGFGISVYNNLNVYNNIIWGNTATTGGDIHLVGYGTANGYNNDYATMSGSWNSASGNINVDPLFVGGGNYHLRSTSPCIDTGNNSAPYLPILDFEGHDRIIDGDYNGTVIVDMGADEFVPKIIVDFDGDGETDILWRHKTSGQNAVWLMNGTTWSSTVRLPAVADTNWEIVGSGGFNDDGKTDILWRHKTDGRNSVWVMNGTTWSSTASLPGVADTNWEIGGAGDFNNDGKTDILWRHKTSGQNAVWLMNGTTWSSTVPLPGVADTNWEIVGP
jgi:hypothetical protein